MANKIKLRISYHNANDSDRLDLQELLHSLDINITLISETKLPTWFEWRNPGYKTYNTRGPNLIYGGTAVLVKSYIQYLCKDLCNELASGSSEAGRP